MLGGRPGGSAANTARALASAGHKVRMFGKVGTDSLGRKLVDDLRDWKVSIKHVDVVPGASSQVIILIESSGERSLIALGGAEINDIGLGARELHCDCAFFGSSSPGFVAAMRQLCKLGRLVVATIPMPTLGEWPAQVMIGSRDQIPDSWRNSPFDAARNISDSLLRWLVVTRGPEGATIFAEHGTTEISAVSVPAVDATGAGDAFAAGLIHGLLDGRDIADAARLGSLWGANATLLHSSSPPKWADVHQSDVRRGPESVII